MTLWNPLSSLDEAGITRATAAPTVLVAISIVCASGSEEHVHTILSKN
jgi:hypothetical protein